MSTNEQRHQDWIGMAQPEGLVVTAAALKAAEANVTSPVADLQAGLRDLAGEGQVVLDVAAMLREILGWPDEFVVAGPDLPAALRVTLDGGEVLAPTLALRSADEPEAFVLLVEVVPWRTELDAAQDDRRWTATAHQRFERLLRETGVHVGLLTNGKVFRLVYAPRGESAGWITFRLAEMLAVDGRPLLGAFHMLLNERRLLTLEAERRLPALLKASREYQNTVSNALREQILAALRELLVGFQAADRVADGRVLRDYRQGHLQEVYKGLVTVLMRMVFVLYAEEQRLLPMEHDLYASAYSLTRLYAQLQEDRARHGDAIDDRFGAWARVIALFRVLHDGVRSADGLSVPARRGTFFDPDAFPFLEGRGRGDVRQRGAVLELPRVSDGVVYRVLDGLLVLEGERLNYKGLDVEQIGSVYEGLMGFELEVAEGPSLTLTPDHVVVNLEALLALPGGDRGKQLKAWASLDLKDKTAAEVRDAKSIEALQAALARRVSTRQPGLLAKGTLVLQPGEERRRSGSHYTPRSLTQPIVETTLRPIFERLGPDVRPEQILELRICDPAMGSGAFLVETCRQLAERLVQAWRRTATMPELPPDEDPLLHARRLVAQRCLYGVDKNPLAADLARLSMWLVTFAREHPFTFVDHALRCGDSLVGLTREQIVNMSFDVRGGWKQLEVTRAVVEKAVHRAEALRREIHAIGDPPDVARLVELWRDANEALRTARMLGDLVVAAFFSADGDTKARRRAIEDAAEKAAQWLQTGAHETELRGMGADLRASKHPIEPFHWEIEFPEVCGRSNGGFDGLVGNPPFAGKVTILHSSGDQYIEWLQCTHEQSHGNADLVAHFFRRAFRLIRTGGTIGLIATNTIAQGDTRETALGWILRNGGLVYSARTNVSWPGMAAVIVSVVHVAKSPDWIAAASTLNGRDVRFIDSSLSAATRESVPVPVKHDVPALVGVKPYGEGFILRTTEAAALGLHDADPSGEVLRPYVGGVDINTQPDHRSDVVAIDFGHRSEDEARRWPKLYAVIEDRVKPVRLRDKREGRRRLWWQFEIHARELYELINRRRLRTVIAAARVSKHWAPTFIDAGQVINEKVIVWPSSDFKIWCILAARCHEAWLRRWGSSLKFDINYSARDSYDTFPFPILPANSAALEELGQSAWKFRAGLLVKNGEGLTKTYNRFHDPDERSPDIRRLRDLHAAMDRAVLDAYGWTDIQPAYDFRPQLDESIRYTWSEDTRDEVLARLLELNRTIAERETQTSATSKPVGGGRKRPPKRAAEPATLPLLALTPKEKA